MPLRRLLIIGGVLLGVAALAVGLWATVVQPAGPSPAAARPGAPAPPISLPIVGGGASDLRADQGKVVLVNFWATWCEPCKAEMPALQRLTDDLRDQPFRLYSVDLQEDEEQVQRFQTQYGLRLYALLDENGDVTRAYNVRGLPATFLIDQRGMLRQQRLGPLVDGSPETSWSPPWLAAQVQALLATG
jgi:thiol-disulfide isomerase/thioredoxin